MGITAFNATSLGGGGGGGGSSGGGGGGSPAGAWTSSAMACDSLWAEGAPVSEMEVAVGRPSSVDVEAAVEAAVEADVEAEVEAEVEAGVEAEAEVAVDVGAATEEDEADVDVERK